MVCNFDFQVWDLAEEGHWKCTASWKVITLISSNCVYMHVYMFHAFYECAQFQDCIAQFVDHSM